MAAIIHLNIKPDTHPLTINFTPNISLNKCYNALSLILNVIFINAEQLFHQEEFEEPTFIWYIRTVDEFKAPLLNKNSAVYREGLRLVSLETKFIPCPWQEKLRKRCANGACLNTVNAITPCLFKHIVFCGCVRSNKQIVFNLKI